MLAGEKLQFMAAPLLGAGQELAPAAVDPPAVDGALQPDYAGIRPKLHGPGEAQGDFVIDSEAMPNFVALFGIESPGLTSSMAIGEEVARRLV